MGVLIAPSIGSAPRAAAPAATGTNYYVDLHAPCTGDGSLNHPFCTIAAAVAVAGPGDVVTIEPGTYNESITVTRSGTATAPITFTGMYVPGAHTILRAPGATSLDLTGVSHVVVKDLDIETTGETMPVVISGSNDITFDSSDVNAGVATSVVSITAGSQDVRITRDFFASATGNGVRIDSGVSGVTVSTDVIQILRSPATAVSATDAPGITVTSNTILMSCATAIALAGSSTGAAVFNNIVSVGKTASCAAGAPASVSVSSGSVSGTNTGYNVIDPRGGGPLYTWDGTDYSTITAFAAATGQGTNDVGADPMLKPPVAMSGGEYYPLAVGSPAIDSADAGASGELATDEFDNYRADDPDAPNSGTGVGYADRGAYEWIGTAAIGGGNVVPDAGGAPLTATASIAVTPAWTTNGPYGTLAYLSDSIPYWHISRDTTNSIVVPRAETFCMTEYVSVDRFHTWTGSSLLCTTVGAAFTPVAPVRVLDTRNAIGVGTTTPVPAFGTVTVPISAAGMPNEASVSAVVLNVTVTQPSTAGYLTVYTGGASQPAASNLNFAAHQTVANVATVQMYNGTISFYNGSSGTVHILADFAGYYGAAGDNFASVAPARVLDTRQAIGVPKAAPLGAHATATVDMSGVIPATAHAVVLNMTATGGTAAGFLTAYPAGAALPSTSSLNYAARSTVANEVIVPVSNGKIKITNGSVGTVNVIADLTGWFGPASAGANQQYVPYGPARIMDTRANGGLPLPPRIPIGTNPGESGTGCSPICPFPRSFVFNVTATQPTAAGFMTVYPDPVPPNASTPPTTSTLNFGAGQTVANVTTVRGDLGDEVYDGSPGTVHVIIDEQGFYIDPTHPF